MSTDSYGRFLNEKQLNEELTEAREQVRFLKERIEYANRALELQDDIINKLHSDKAKLTETIEEKQDIIDRLLRTIPNQM